MNLTKKMLKEKARDLFLWELLASMIYMICWSYYLIYIIFFYNLLFAFSMGIGVYLGVVIYKNLPKSKWNIKGIVQILVMALVLNGFIFETMVQRIWALDIALEIYVFLERYTGIWFNILPIALGVGIYLGCVYSLSYVLFIALYLLRERYLWFK